MIVYFENTKGLTCDLVRKLLPALNDEICKHVTSSFKMIYGDPIEGEDLHNTEGTNIFLTNYLPDGMTADLTIVYGDHARIDQPRKGYSERTIVTMNPVRIKDFIISIYG